MALFSKQDWLKRFPEFFYNGSPAIKAFGSYQEQDKHRFLMALIGTMSLVYRGLHHFLPVNNASSLSEQEIKEQVKNAVLPAWCHALADCSVAQILSGLFLVVGGRTEYVEFPPSTVLKFRAICMGHRPAFHDVVQNPTTAPQLGWDKEAAEKRKEMSARHGIIRLAQEHGGSSKAVETLKGICRRHGLDIKKLDDVQMTEEEQALYDSSACYHHEYNMQLKQYHRVKKDLR